MKTKKSKFMNQSLVKQYPLNDLKDVIYISTDIVEIFLIELEEGFNMILHLFALMKKNILLQ